MEYGFSKELYPTQKSFIKKAIEIIDNKNIGVLSSPTGTGKTISLLCTVLHYIKKFDYDDDFFAMLNNSNKTKIYYCSRTHSQLIQVISELKGNKDKYKSIILGSRKVYCINDKCINDNCINDKCINDKCNDKCINENKKINEITKKFKRIKKENINIKIKELNINILNEKCKSLIRNDSCEYHKGSFFTSEILDIEELNDLGRKKIFCPYYYSREQSSKCEIVLLPYNLLFTKEGRKSLDIKLENKILIIDEAHNIYDIIIQLNSANLNWADIKLFLSVKNLSKDLIEIITKLLKFYKNIKNEQIIDILTFLKMTNLESFNMFDIEEFIVDKKFAEKNEMVTFYELAKFLKLLTYSDEYGRIIFNMNYIKFIPLNPEIYMEELKKCQSIIFTGGTMEPIFQLQKIFPDLIYQNFPAVSENYMVSILTRYVTRKQARFTYERRLEDIEDMINTLVMLTNPILNGGIVIFLSSYSILQLVKNNKKSINFKRKIYFEDEIVFNDYKLNPDILFAVMGGNLSEGINFSDELCRLLIIVGIPYPMKDIENQERSKYFPEYNTLTAMKIVNQTIGRALRHKEDYASIILLDSRYLELRKNLSFWINKKLKILDPVQAMVQTKVFLNKF